MRRPPVFGCVGLVLSLLPFASLLRAADDPDRQKEAAAIIKMVQDSQRAGVVNGDLKAFLSVLTDDARAVLGRGEKPSRYDVTISRKQMEARGRLRMRDKESFGGRLDFTDSAVTFEGETARLTYRGYRSLKDDLGIADEVFLLRRTKSGWKVFENRYWLVEHHAGSEVTKYDEKKWKALDEEVARLEKQDDPLMVVWALSEAFRYVEAYTKARKLTEAKPDDAVAWNWRGYLALQLGHVDDAMASYKKALELDDSAPVPSFVREPESGGTDSDKPKSNGPK